MGETLKFSCPSVNLVIGALLPDRSGSLKIEVVVAEDCNKCAIIITSLGYQLLKIYAPARYRKFLHGYKFSGAK